MVAPGATVSAGQSVMELETDKAVLEVPSSVTGTVQEIRVKEGDKIKVGQVIFTVENGAGAKAVPEAAAKPALPKPEMASKAEVPKPVSTVPSTPPTAQTSSTQAASGEAPVPATQSAPPRERRAQTPPASEFKLPE